MNKTVQTETFELLKRVMEEELPSGSADVFGSWEGDLGDLVLKRCTAVSFVPAGAMWIHDALSAYMAASKRIPGLVETSFAEQFCEGRSRGYLIRFVCEPAE